LNEAAVLNFISSSLLQSLPDFPLITHCSALVTHCSLLIAHHSSLFKDLTPKREEHENRWSGFLGRGDLRVCHPLCLLGWHGHQEERDLAPGAVFEEAGRPSAVLTGDFIAGSTGGMTDGRKKRKGFR